MQKICSKCKLEKSTEDFFKDKQKKSGLKPECKICSKIKVSEFKKRTNYKGRKDTLIKYNTGLSLEIYNKLLAKQDYKCGICEIKSTDYHKMFSFDHDYITDKVRGLLCNRCNMAIGALGDSINNLRKAISYLEKEPTDYIFNSNNKYILKRIKNGKNNSIIRQ